MPPDVGEARLTRELANQASLRVDVAADSVGLDEEDADPIEVLVAGEDLDLAPLGVHLQHVSRRQVGGVECGNVDPGVELLRAVGPAHVVAQAAFVAPVDALEEAHGG